MEPGSEPALDCVVRGLTPVRFHDGDSDHVHELFPDARGKLTEYIWKVENVALTTVGIDIGSSTSHLMFAAVRLQRKTQSLSSQFVVVERRVLWKSPILLTPFRPDGSIDAQQLGAFVKDCYREAGLAPGEIDTGAVILTGEAIKRSNARALADVLAGESGNFVCASAGHHLESVLAAHGSGAGALSRASARTLLNVDVGGGTTKLALLADGKVVSTCAFAVGGRLLAFDAQGCLERIDDSARLAAADAGVELRMGERPAAVDLQRVVKALADAAIALMGGGPVTPLAQSLLLTEPLSHAIRPQAIMFSGGVSEYIYGREQREFGDIAKPLAAHIASACSAGLIDIPLIQPGEGIRATVIGASQFSVQVSGKTIHVGDAAALPLRNVPVIAPVLRLGDAIDAGEVAQAIVAATLRAPSDEGLPVALAIHWRGDPHHARLRALAEGIALAMVQAAGAEPLPLVLMIDGDVGRTLGHILEHELALDRAVVCIDGIQLKEFDFVDIGEMIRPADVVPVVIKSLLFSEASAAAPSATNRYAPANAIKRKAR